MKTVTQNNNISSSVALAALVLIITIGALSFFMPLGMVVVIVTIILIICVGLFVATIIKYEVPFPPQLGDDQKRPRKPMLSASSATFIVEDNDNWDGIGDDTFDDGVHIHAYGDVTNAYETPMLTSGYELGNGDIIDHDVGRNTFDPPAYPSPLPKKRLPVEDTQDVDELRELVRTPDPHFKSVPVENKQDEVDIPDKVEPIKPKLDRATVTTKPIPVGTPVDRSVPTPIKKQPSPSSGSGFVPKYAEIEQFAEYLGGQSETDVDGENDLYEKVMWDDLFQSGKLRLGIDVDSGQVMYLDLKDLMNTRIVGKKKKGKTVLLHLMATQFQVDGGYTILIDPNRKTFPNGDTRWGDVIYEQDEIVKELHALKALSQNRNQMIMDCGERLHEMYKRGEIGEDVVNDYHDDLYSYNRSCHLIGKKPRPPIALFWDEVNTSFSSNSKLAKLLFSLATDTRTAGIHLFLAGHDYKGETFGVSVREQFGTCIAFHTDKYNSEMFTGSRTLAVEIGDKKGRFYIVVNGETDDVREVQGFFMPKITVMKYRNAKSTIKIHAAGTKSARKKS